MTSGTTRLHIDLSHIPQLCRSSKFNCYKNNNNSNRSTPYFSNNLLVKCKQKSVCLMQSRTDSFYDNIPNPVRSKTGSSQSVHPSTNPTHPYLREGWPARRIPKKFLSSSNKQSPSNNSQNYLDVYLPKDEVQSGLTVKQRKQLLMTIPHFRRSITPNDDSIEIRSDLQETNSHEVPVPVEPDLKEGQENSLIPTALISPIQDTMEQQSDEESDFKDQTQSTPVEELPSLPIRPKLSLSRRCSEATLPLTFSFQMPKKSYKTVKKPRSKTYDVIPETENITFGNSLNYENTTDSDLISKSEVLFSRSQDQFMSSRILKPRHSVYFYHSPMNFDSTPEQIGSNHQLNFKKISTDKSMFGIQLESSQQDCSDNCSDRNLSTELSPILPYQDTHSFLSDSSLTEESSPGDVRSNGPTRDSNKDINHSENYSNTFDSQECINVSSSTEDIIGENLSDSGYHFDQQKNKHFSTQSVKKVILDLSQQKYVGLSLVGGADSPFGNLPVLVKEIMSGGAAECCDISRGDEILGINSFSLEDKPLQFAVERLRHCSSRDEEIILWIIPQLDSS